MIFCMDGPNDLGKAIRRLRGDRPQSKLADAAGMKPSTWSDYERGKRSPRGKNLARIASALGVDAKTLEQEVLKVGRERLSLDEAGAPSAAGVETSESLLRETDRMLRKVDHNLDDLLLVKKLLLTLRQYLLDRPAGTRIIADR